MLYWRLLGKGGAKKGDAASGDKGSGDGVIGAAAARRADVSELKGLVEVRASSQAARAGAAAVTGEGRPLLQVRVRIGLKMGDMAGACKIRDALMLRWARFPPGCRFQIF